jgi:hypothetical protein
VLTAVVIVVVGCDASGPASDFESEAAAAEAFCPVLWNAVTEIGATFNDAAADVRSLPGAVARRARWSRALDRIEGLVVGLAADVSAWSDDDVLGPLVAQIRRDVPLATAELADIRALFDEYPDLDDAPPQERTQQLIVRIEKVIDLPKPDLTAGDDDAVVAAFRSVPSCQHAVRGADDGTPRANG